LSGMTSMTILPRQTTLRQQPLATLAFL